eukprot:gene32291-16857_t
MRHCIQRSHGAVSTAAQLPSRPVASPARMLDRSRSSQSVESSSFRQRIVKGSVMPEDRTEHNAVQASKFSKPSTIKVFSNKLPESIEKKLARIKLACIVNSPPDLGPDSRIVDVGSGTGCLIPHMQARGVKDILAVDLSEAMLKELSDRYVTVGTLGNDLEDILAVDLSETMLSILAVEVSETVLMELSDRYMTVGILGHDLGVRTWLGDIVDVPMYMGRGCDAVFMNGCFGNMHSPRDALLHSALLTKPGGHIVVSHPMGRAWHRKLREGDMDMVPHELPDRAALEAMLVGLPLRITEFVDKDDHYCATLQVPPAYAFPSGAPPLLLEGPVVRGFGRGSRLLAVPTANIDPFGLGDVLKSLPLGVYFGWAKLDAPSNFASADNTVHKAVLNIGRRPTVNQGDEALSVEAHILHDFNDTEGEKADFVEFYGSKLRVLLLGYIRPEMRFAGGLPELISRINIDVATSKNLLDEAELQALKSDERLTAPWASEE